ncbi:hypothetical protein KY284_008088 [Solanum tuberosum]|nr:hypothetical protein KY284_008088 [Solanum tuberosum]
MLQSSTFAFTEKGSCFRPDVYKLILSYSQLDILELWEFLFTKNYEEPQEVLGPQRKNWGSPQGFCLLDFKDNTHATGEIWSNGFCLNQQIVSAEPSAAHCMHISSVQQ